MKRKSDTLVKILVTVLVAISGGGCENSNRKSDNAKPKTAGKDNVTFEASQTLISDAVEEQTKTFRCTLVNPTDRSFKIGEISTSCSCTVLESVGDVNLQPLSRRVISGSIRLPKRSGKFEATVAVQLVDTLGNVVLVPHSIVVWVKPLNGPTIVPAFAKGELDDEGGFKTVVGRAFCLSGAWEDVQNFNLQISKPYQIVDNGMRERGEKGTGYFERWYAIKGNSKAGDVVFFDIFLDRKGRTLRIDEFSPSFGPKEGARINVPAVRVKRDGKEMLVAEIPPSLAEAVIHPDDSIDALLRRNGNMLVCESRVERFTSGLIQATVALTFDGGSRVVSINLFSYE